ncbi:MAG: hypothetical protein F6K40_11235 [Okeania sp. SIO3I5]|uniref:hypothetical protein n=1 Tax=Okeania sp. SIO3I5 TaxID=2607805 RepID=UPI0013BCB122|nr:hypothetical protein [Okeania sp. SIO3I5]NEQ36818.1 hypothetical protein [Okeania sp. SIO3I5]
MRRGERLHLNFTISQKFPGCNRKFFEARFFSGASENENVGGFLLRRDGWKILVWDFFITSQKMRMLVIFYSGEMDGNF